MKVFWVWSAHFWIWSRSPRPRARGRPFFVDLKLAKSQRTFAQPLHWLREVLLSILTSFRHRFFKRNVHCPSGASWYLLRENGEKLLHSPRLSAIISVFIYQKFQKGGIGKGAFALNFLKLTFKFPTLLRTLPLKHKTKYWAILCNFRAQFATNLRNAPPCKIPLLGISEFTGS